MSHPNAQLLHTFYSCFQKLDHEGMRACYHPEATFQDEVFQLRGQEIGDMWQMLCTRAQDFELTYSVLQADEETGTAHWEPRYTFSATGRTVHNIIDSDLRFRDGKIYSHRDRFNFWRWTRMALGPAGLLLGWTPFLRSKVAGQANRGLQKFIAAKATEAGS